MPKLICFGLALAPAISSASVLYGSVASMISTSGGPSTIQPIMGEVVDRAVGHRDVVQVLRIGERIGEQRIAVGRRPAPRAARRPCPSLRSCSRPRWSGRASPASSRPEPRRHVGQAARRERHHEGDRPARIVLRRCARQSAPQATRPRAADHGLGVSSCVAPDCRCHVAGVTLQVSRCRCRADDPARRRKC